MADDKNHCLLVMLTQNSADISSFTTLMVKPCDRISHSLLKNTRPSHRTMNFHQDMEQAQGFETCHQVLATAELFQEILLNLSTQVLSVAAHVSTDWAQAVKKIFLLPRRIRCIPGGWNLCVREYKPVGHIRKNEPPTNPDLQVTFTEVDHSRAVLFAVQREDGIEYVDLMCDEHGPWRLLAPFAFGFMVSARASVFRLQLFSEEGQDPYLDVAFDVESTKKQVLEV
ncbi:hypothetical protein DOTSEDRAFT_39468 [Dothistroma septosporum NZE10]|uniref:Uncharacterized protein n=1 Tax=Dothistroma septosporum (strain NZE10 / CBS 128990) TaxID=675120 RepID=N1PE72_DOTSN|nr:hypothetical protein DOTSEDRAFT_39468 [Dothistroma septosporum NZE10]